LPEIKRDSCKFYQNDAVIIDSMFCMLDVNNTTVNSNTIKCKQIKTTRNVLRFS